MARPKSLDNQSYQELVETANKLGIEPVGDIYELREKIRTVQADAPKAPSVGELAQAAVRKENENDAAAQAGYDFDTEKKRIEKALAPFKQHGLIVLYGGDKGAEWYQTAYRNHSESSHITTPTHQVRQQAAKMLQLQPYTPFMNSTGTGFGANNDDE